MKERLEHIAKDIQLLQNQSTDDSEPWNTVETSNTTAPSISSFRRIGTFHGMFLRILKRDI